MAPTSRQNRRSSTGMRGLSKSIRNKSNRDRGGHGIGGRRRAAGRDGEEEEGSGGVEKRAKNRQSTMSHGNREMASRCEGDSGDEHVKDDESVSGNWEGGGEISTQDISELETDVTTLIRNTGKSDGWPAAFEDRIRDRERELIEKIRAGSVATERAEESFHKATFAFLAGCIARVGMKPERAQNPFPIADPSPDNQPLFTKSAALVEASRDLVQQYSALADLRIDTASRDRLLKTLNKEEDDIAAAIKAGKRVAQAETMGLLGLVDDSDVENGRHGSDVLRIGFQEAEAQARLRGEAVEAKTTEEWAAVAADTVRAFGKMSRVVDGSDIVD